MDFEHYQASMDTELRAGFAQMMTHTGNTKGQPPGPGDLAARRKLVAAFAVEARRHLPQ